MTLKCILLENFHNIRIVHVIGKPDFQNNIPHSHSHSEAFIHLSGEMDLFVENNIYKVTDHTVRLYASGELHGGRYSSNCRDVNWYQISLPHDFLSKEPYTALGSVFFDRTPGEHNVFSSARRNELYACMGEIFSAFDEKNPLAECIAADNVIRVLCIINDSANNTSHYTAGNTQRLNKIIEIINRESASINCVADLCRLTHYSNSYLSRMFRQALGTTPYKFIIGKKLDNAKKLLAGGNTVNVACEYAGFDSYNNFITLFRKTFGITPKQYQIAVWSSNESNLLQK